MVGSEVLLRPDRLSQILYSCLDEEQDILAQRYAVLAFLNSVLTVLLP